MFDWGTHWALFFLPASLWVAAQVGKKTHWSVGVFTWVTLAPALLYTFLPTSPYKALPDIEPVFIDAEMRGAIISLLLFLPLFWVPRKAWLYILPTYCYANALVTLVAYIFGQAPPLGLTGSAAVSAALGAVTLPFLWQTIQKSTYREPFARWSCRLIPVLACLLSRSSLAYGVLGVVLTVQLLYSRWWWCSVAALPWALGAGHLLQHRTLFSTRGRTEIWGTYLQYAREHFNWLVGSGLGSTPYHLPLALANWTYKAQGTCVWVHNDWLQVLTEQGLLGFACLCTLSGYTLWKARKRAGLQAALWGYMAAAVGQFLPHGALSSAIGIGLLVITWSGDEKSGAAV